MFRLLANPDLDSHCGSPFRSSTYVDEPFKSTHHFIAWCPSLEVCIQGHWGMPAPWRDTPIIAPFESNFNDYSMRVRSTFCSRQEAVGSKQSALGSKPDHDARRYRLPLTASCFLNYTSSPSSAIVRRSSIT